MIGKLIMQRAQKAKRLSSGAALRLHPGKIGKLIMRRARKAKRLSSSALQRLYPGMIGIRLILCPTNHDLTLRLCFGRLARGRGARLAPRTGGDRWEIVRITPT